ncbi:hypothetical protein QA596_06710 [Balneolales bacterium ANBcel1]|nr:hypothetical protein [Balneolales bacterium ANBcel1]
MQQIFFDRFTLLILAALVAWASAPVQSQAQDTAVPYYVNEQGILISSETGEEASFFGINYSPPFAHSWRAMDLLGMDHKEEMDKDIYHFARMGFDAFRIHVWDTEISDSLGNLLHNEHLDLLDYKLWQMEERGIKVILTPLTFYDNAYPDGATPTPGFANYISKTDAPRPEYRDILKNYLDQFLTHKNPYTGKTYQEDPNIIAVELVNEPLHSGDLDEITAYINDLADFVRDNGWEKPVFYNIAENPPVVDAVMNADIDGVGFQWYPGGLVGGQAIRKNYLPYIDEYAIPFGNREAMQDKFRFIYEFDSSDLMYSYAYPVMARSFRAAGFQWATQFAYDPLGIAFANSDYPTHYLNMIYTPGKAVSMRIAGEVFRSWPLGKEPEPFPHNKQFGDFRVSHSEDLSEMNTDTAFYYSNHTQTEPRDASALQHIAGVGNSPVVHYEGTGAYFLDKLEDGVWRLEVMPDVIAVRDPFEPPAFDKHVSVIEWHERSMEVRLPNLGDRFAIEGMNEGNDRSMAAEDGSFRILPGAYILTRQGSEGHSWGAGSRFGNIRVGEYVAIESTSDAVRVRHNPLPVIDEGEAHTIRATVAGTGPGARVHLIGNIFGELYFDEVMEEVAAFEYEFTMPAGMVNSGLMNYWIVVEEEGGFTTFPGEFDGHPWDWNFYHDDVWEVHVASADTPVSLFETARDLGNINFAFQTWQHEVYHRGVDASDRPGRKAVWVRTDDLAPVTTEALGWAAIVRDNVEGRKARAQEASELMVRGKSMAGDASVVRVILVQRDGSSFSAELTLSGRYEEHYLSLDDFRRDAFMLLPRPYPPFMPFWFNSAADPDLNPAGIEEIQLVTGADHEGGDSPKKAGFAVTSVWLR